jgi:hypothetical protein
MPEKSSADLLNFARPDAASADMHPYVPAVGPHGLHELQIRFGHLLGLVVRMTYLIAAQLAFSADLTCTSHCKPSIKNAIYTCKGGYLTISTPPMQGKNACLSGDLLDITRLLL